MFKTFLLSGLFGFTVAVVGTQMGVPFSIQLAISLTGGFLIGFLK